MNTKDFRFLDLISCFNDSSKDIFLAESYYSDQNDVFKYVFKTKN